MRSDLLRPLEWRVEAPSPGGGVMVVERLGTELVRLREPFLHAERLAARTAGIDAVGTALAARTVVADDVEHERVVALPFLTDRLEHAAYFIIGVRKEAGI